MHGVDLKKIYVYIELYSCIYIYTQYFYMYQLFCIFLMYWQLQDQHGSACEW